MPLQLAKNVLFLIAIHANQAYLLANQTDVLQILNLSAIIAVKFLLRVVMLYLKVLHVLADIFSLIKLA